MALLSIANVTFAFGDRVVLDGVNLTLSAGEHVGLVGRNGCGKSTLMKLIAGIAEHGPDGGQIQLARGAKAGYLTQDPDVDLTRTLREEAGAAFTHLHNMHERMERLAHDMASAEGNELERLMKQYEQTEHEVEAAGGFAVDHKIDETLHGLGLTDAMFDVRVGDLSGGQKGRLSLAKLLLSEPDLLLLDEPTNHLDIAGRQWLEQFLAGYNGAVIVISHDRWLLDHCVTKIYELELGELVEYPGHYEKFRELRTERRLAQQRVFDKQQTYIKHQQSFIDRYKAGQRAKQARGRESRLERYIEQETVEKPVEFDEISLRLSPKSRCGDVVIAAEHLAMAYEDKPLFDDVTVTIKRGDRVGIIGPNGAGKTTLVRCMVGDLPPHRGKAKIGAQVDVGYYRQTHEHLDLSLTVVEYLQRFVANKSEQEARGLAGAFLFSGLDQDKPLGVLSGGERSRAVLAGLMVLGHNLLVLDEPTNHLDISSAERLEEALRQYTTIAQKYGNNRTNEGTLLLITHDRMLLDHLVDQLLIFDGNGGVEHFIGRYNEYLDVQKLAKARADEAAAVAVEEAKEEAEQKKQAEVKQQADVEKREQAGGNGSKSKGDAKQNEPGASGAKKVNRRWQHLSQNKLDGRIAELEGKIKELDAQLIDPETYKDQAKFSKLEDEHTKLTKELSQLEEEWLARADS